MKISFKYFLLISLISSQEMLFPIPAQEPLVKPPPKYERGTEAWHRNEEKKEEQRKKAFERKKKIELLQNVEDLPVVYVRLGANGKVQPAYVRTANKELFVWDKVVLDESYLKDYIQSPLHPLGVFDMPSEKSGFQIKKIQPAIFYAELQPGLLFPGYFHTKKGIFFQLSQQATESLDSLGPDSKVDKLQINLLLQKNGNEFSPINKRDGQKKLLKNETLQPDEASKAFDQKINSPTTLTSINKHKQKSESKKIKQPKNKRASFRWLWIGPIVVIVGVVAFLAFQRQRG